MEPASAAVLILFEPSGSTLTSSHPGRGTKSTKIPNSFCDSESKGSTAASVDDGDEVDSDVSCLCDGVEEGAGTEDVESDDDAVAELVEAESARKKIEVLAAMVGMRESDEPAAVLAEVVKALRELERKAELAGWSSSRRQGSEIDVLEEYRE